MSIPFDQSDAALDALLSKAVRRTMRAGVVDAYPLYDRRSRMPTAYRLLLDLPVSIIAKCVRPEVAAHEWHLYEKVLPSRGVLVPRLLAVVPTEGATWMLLEDLGEERPDPSRKKHADLLAAWLAALHAPAAPAGLPRLDADFYGAELRRCEEILRSWGPKLSPEGSAVRGDALRGIEVATAMVDVWAAELTAGSRLLHGDFQAKNLRVVRIGAAQAVAAFDWEMAGVGHPGVDARVFPDTVLARVAPLLSVALDELARMVSLGGVLWAVRAMGWALGGDQPGYGPRLRRRIIGYSATMAKAGATSRP